MTGMAEHLDINDVKYPILAADILGRHQRNEAEANVTSAIRDFLIQTGLETRTETPYWEEGFGQ